MTETLPALLFLALIFALAGANIMIRWRQP